MSELPFSVSEREIEQALHIVLNYFDMKNGFVSISFAKDALEEVYRQRTLTATRALVLANRAIKALEERSRKKQAA